MTDNTTQPTTPKKSYKKFFVLIALILGLLGIDHYTYHFVSGGVDVTVTDSTIVVTAPIDTTITIAKVDTAINIVKVDTSKK